MLVLGVRGEKPPDMNCTPEYMVKTILLWRVLPSLKEMPGVDDAIHEFLAKMTMLTKDHSLHFRDRHAFSVSFAASISYDTILMCF